MARRELYRIWNLHDRIISYYTIKFGIILIAYYIDDNHTDRAQLYPLGDFSNIYFEKHKFAQFFL